MMKNRKNPCGIGSYAALKEFERIMSHQAPIMWAEQQMTTPRNSIGFWAFYVPCLFFVILCLYVVLNMAIDLFKTGGYRIKGWIFLIIAFSGIVWVLKGSFDFLTKQYHWVLNPDNKQLSLYCNNRLVRIIQVQQSDKLVCKYAYYSNLSEVHGHLMLVELHLYSKQHGKIRLMSMQLNKVFANDKQEKKRHIIQLKHFIRFLAKHLECPLVSDKLSVKAAD